MKVKNIVIASSKGGVGKTLIATGVLSYILRGKDFQLIEIDNNNDTVDSFEKSVLLENKMQALNITNGVEKLEELVIENMMNENKITIIDCGGGDDSLTIIESLKSQNLVNDTLFIIPFFPDFKQLKNLENTFELVKDYKVAVVCNNIDMNNTDDLLFINGDEDFEIPNLSKLYKHFFLIEKSNLFSFSNVRKKETIYDFAQAAFNFKQNEILEWAKEKTNGDKKAMLSIYRDWKLSRLAKDYLLNPNMKKLEAFILKEIN